MKWLIAPDEGKRRAAEVRLLVLDVDGVLTDGGLLMHPDGDESKVFHVRDGLGLRLLMGTGVEVGLITGRQSRVVAARAADLGIVLVAQGSLDKVAAYERMLEQRRLSERQTAYVGDDLVDIPVMRRVGLALTVADADPAVRPFSHAITERRGGRGAVREVCELILQAQGSWERAVSRFVDR